MEIVQIKCPKCNDDNAIIIRQLDFDLLLKCKNCNHEFESSQGNI